MTKPTKNRVRPVQTGRVSVVAVVHDGADPAVQLGQLRTLDWPADRLELIAVVCGATQLNDGDASRVVTVAPDASLAEARNRGAAAARGEYLAFFGPHVTPAPDWLHLTTSVIASQSSVAAVAGTVLDGRSQTVRYVDAALSFDGRPRFPEAGKVFDTVVAQSADVLFPPAAALLVETRSFDMVDGFDEQVGSVEFADLGWRLWLCGFRVRYEPHAIAHDSGVVDDLTSETARLGALRMLYKNAGSESRDRALAGGLLLDANRSAPVGPRFVADLSTISEGRASVQARRMRPESEIVALFRDPLTAEPGEEEVMSRVRNALQLDQLFPERHRIAIVTPDVLQSRMAGPAIRAWHMALALAREHDVELVTTAACSLTNASFPVHRVDDAGLKALDNWCEVLIFQGHILENHPWLQRSHKILVADIYDPMHLEVLEQSRDQAPHERRNTVRVTTEVLNKQLERGDFFLCASQKQRNFWLGQLAAVGRINPATYDARENLEELITVVPFGLGNDPPRHNHQVLKGVTPGIGPDDKVILWGGGVYNWFDPVTLVRAVDRLRARLPNVRLYFMGMRHPNPDVPMMEMAVRTQALAAELDLTGRYVFFNEDWVPYDDRHNYLLEADVGVSTHLDHVETEFSFRTRILDYIWATLPIVATSGDAFAEIIEHESLGFVVPPGDTQALEEALFRLLTDDDARRDCRDAISRYSHNLRWELVLDPLKRFCRNPRRAPDLIDPWQRVMVGDPMAQSIWGARGWRDTLRVLIDHARHREYDEIVRKVRVRIRILIFPEAGGPGARTG